MGEHADRFFAELAALYQAAGRPTLERLVALGAQQQPPIRVADSTIHGWLNGDAVPGARSARYFTVMIAFLQHRAAGGADGYTSHSPGRWQHLMTQASRERDQARGGRPRKPGRTAAPAGPVTLPPAPAGFTGRNRAMEEVLAWLEPGHTQAHPEATVVVSAVAGMGGVGKTALVVQAAHQARLRGWFPGGILFANLHGYSTSPAVTPGAVVDQFLRALGVKAKDLPALEAEKRDAWRIALDDLATRGRPLLIVLDNARTAGQVASLLPSQPHRALVTSRQTLATLPAHPISLAPLPPAEALDLLDNALRAGGTGDERAQTQRQDAQHLTDLCGCLPLALRIIAALLRADPERTLADQAAELADARHRLDALDSGDMDDEGRPLAVRATFDLSYQSLSADHARAFRLLAAAPGADISTAAATVLLDRPAARGLLTGLARAHLLQPSPGGRDRWSMHDLIRLFADDYGHRHAAEDQRQTAVSRLLDDYLTQAEAADAYLGILTDGAGMGPFGDRGQALAWLEAERGNLVAAADAAREHRHRADSALAFALARFVEHRRYFEDWIALTTSAVTVLHDFADLHGKAQALNNLGTALQQVQRLEEAIDAHTQATAIFRETGDRLGEGQALNNLGLALRRTRRRGEALAAHTAAGTALRAVGDRYGEATTRNNLGLALAEMKRFGDAITAHLDASMLFRETGDRQGEGQALNNLGLALAALRQLEDSLNAHGRAAEIFQEIGDGYGEATARSNLGFAMRQTHKPAEAVRFYAEAARLFAKVGDVHGEASARDSLGHALWENRRVEEAVDAYSDAVLLFGKAGDQQGEAVAWSRLGAALEACGRFDQADEAKARASTLSQKGGKQRGERGTSAAAHNERWLFGPRRRWAHER